ncbi:hypothetical protein HI802_02950 [Ralstonia solanacearum]|nr:hypothetical protein HI802_02950 [Ralstonia solanacearum]QKL96216.1 hypothetical protein HI801_02950 [Ralstonia solanacearum]QLR09330.1 hypothetical protein H1A20_02925 [Ralstonia solanacearum]
MARQKQFDERVSVSFTPSQLDLVQHAAAVAGIPTAVFLRKATMEHPLVQKAIKEHNERLRRGDPPLVRPRVEAQEFVSHLQSLICEDKRFQMPPVLAVEETGGFNKNPLIDVLSAQPQDIAPLRSAFLQCLQHFTLTGGGLAVRHGGKMMPLAEFLHGGDR